MIIKKLWGGFLAVIIDNACCFFMQILSIAFVSLFEQMQMLPENSAGVMTFLSFPVVVVLYVLGFGLLGKKRTLGLKIYDNVVGNGMPAAASPRRVNFYLVEVLIILLPVIRIVWEIMIAASQAN